MNGNPAGLWTKIAVGVVALLAGGLGCDRGGSTGATAKPPAAVRLGYFPNVTHAQAVLAVANGDFAKAVGPAPFEHREFNAGPSLIEALFAGQIDVGYVGPGPVITAWAKSRGHGINVVSGAAADGVLIVARKDAGIKTLADLKGRTVATPQHGNTQDIAARHYLTAVLGQADTNNVLAIPNADQAAAMAHNQIDAAWVPEPWASALEQQAGAVVVGREKDLWPAKTFSLTVVVTTPEYLAAHRDVVERLLAVHRDWTRKLSADPAKYAGPLDDALATLSGHRLPAGVVADALKNVTFTDDPSPPTFEANAQWAFDLGFAKDKPDLTGLVVDTRKD